MTRGRQRGSSVGGCNDSGGVSSVDGDCVDDNVSDNGSCGVAAMVVAEATATATVMTTAATAGVKRQQSTSIGTVEGERWTQAQRPVMTNNERAWPMMRAATKRVARAMATVTRVAGERRQGW